MVKQGDDRSELYVSRRDFLRYSLSAGVVVWAGSGFPREAGAQTRNLFKVRHVDPAVYPQSIASGDPQPKGIVLWTRLASLNAGSTVAYEVARDLSFRRPILRGTAQTSAEKDNTVKVQLNNRSELRPFTPYYYRFIYNGSASLTGSFKTLPAATGAVPGDRVRFGYVSCQDYTNGYYNALYHLAREQELDFIVHLGDYVYETVGSDSFQGGGPPTRQFRFPDGDDEALTLTDYRFAYKKYKTDPNLQELHRRYAIIQIWDDHEFANDCYQVYAPDEGGTDAEPSRNPQRREAANRAWAEFNPVGVPYDPSGDPLNEIEIYRSFDFGNLMTLVMTDERLYRDGPPNGNETQDRYVTPGAGQEGAGEEAPDRTMLGDGTPSQDGFSRPNQLDYFLRNIADSTRTWKVWGNEVTFMQNKVANTSLEVEGVTVASLDELFGPTFGSSPAGQEIFGRFGAAGTPEGVYITLDQWDGYQAERRLITQRLRDAGVKNFITLTGDIHSYIAGYVKEDYDDRACTGNNAPVGIELVCPSVTSSNLTEIATFGFGAAPQPDVGQFTAAIYANNSHIKYFNSNEHGYNLVEVTPDSFLCTMKAVRVIAPTAENRGSGIREPKPENTRSDVLRRFRVPAGQVLLEEEKAAGVFLPLDCTMGISTGPGGT